jgi:hypothetical protein
VGLGGILGKFQLNLRSTTQVKLTKSYLLRIRHTERSHEPSAKYMSDVTLENRSSAVVVHWHDATVTLDRHLPVPCRSEHSCGFHIGSPHIEVAAIFLTISWLVQSSSNAMCINRLRNIGPE